MMAEGAGVSPIPGIDQLVSDARHLAAELNATLGRLAERDVETISVIGEIRGDGGYMARRVDRVSLCLNFKAKE
jgi:hypothetical protein